MAGERLSNMNNEPKKEQLPGSAIPHSIHIDGYYQGFHIEIIQTEVGDQANTETYSLMKHAKALVDQMKLDGWEPSWNTETNNKVNGAKPEQKTVYQAPENGENRTPICGVHNVPMVWKSGVSQKTNKPYAFWSCATRNADGSFCTYKPPKA